jgi:tRNA dimethylallyltransferase
MSSPVIIVAGPTSSGKSDLAADIAAEFDGVVINADSMQVYRELPILTAQPSRQHMSRVPHRLFAIASANERFSVGAWLRLAVAEIEDSAARGKLPVVCGGTGLYLKALNEGLAAIPPIPDAVRQATRALYDRIGGAAFQGRLAARDPVTASRLASTDRQRLCRAWDVVETTGKPLSEWHDIASVGPVDSRCCTVLLMPPRNLIYAACDRRFEAMMAAGALDEVAALARTGIDRELPAMKALGVTDLMAYLAGTATLETAVDRAKRATRNYAKRQMTWFRHQLTPDLTVFEQYSESLQPKIFPFIREFLLTAPV